MRPYTPAEILQAGADDTRRGSTHLLVELNALQNALGWHWHRINVNADVPLLDGEERLPSYPAPAGFGGNTLAVPARTVHLERLTPAGRWLFWLGGHTARLERERLIDRTQLFRVLVDDARRARTSEQRRADTTAVLQAADANRHRSTRQPVTPVSTTAWPVRIPPPEPTNPERTTA
ncbi:hypothetical protein [Plantibacter sp. CFBP 8804]|uniref:hypothetical protein n=1 Tax=Plantibacter sp. CFBP 8804 TaxID=2775270 RepID=UPI00177C293C|nr:hypothetical protein [Plantibacter sp. CFBP 8804]MBD8519150.1 hypothetical protein [Plantibacter sp. CFBP 8804]